MWISFKPTGKLECVAIASWVFEQHRLECKHSINGFHKQVNLVERTWDDDLRAMSCELGIAIVVLLAIQEQGSRSASHQKNIMS
jgi:hypothetical protein